MVTRRKPSGSSARRHPSRRVSSNRPAAGGRGRARLRDALRPGPQSSEPPAAPPPPRSPGRRLPDPARPRLPPASQTAARHKPTTHGHEAAAAAGRRRSLPRRVAERAAQARRAARPAAREGRHLPDPVPGPPSEGAARAAALADTARPRPIAARPALQDGAQSIVARARLRRAAREPRRATPEPRRVTGRTSARLGQRRPGLDPGGGGVPRGQVKKARAATGAGRVLATGLVEARPRSGTARMPRAILMEAGRGPSPADGPHRPAGPPARLAETEPALLPRWAPPA